MSRYQPLIIGDLIIKKMCIRDRSMPLPDWKFPVRDVIWTTPWAREFPQTSVTLSATLWALEATMEA